MMWGRGYTHGKEEMTYSQGERVYLDRIQFIDSWSVVLTVSSEGDF